jgi:hypothetical protein
MAPEFENGGEGAGCDRGERQGRSSYSDHYGGAARAIR